MQFAIPQFTDVEDKLIGPLTLKQFLTLLATGGVVLFFWSIFKLSILFFLFGLPTALVGVALAFAKFNGRPFFTYIGPFFTFTSKPKLMIYHREGAALSLSHKKTVSDSTRTESEARKEVSESRLSKLAYLLDQKTVEEEKLIEEIK